MKRRNDSQSPGPVIRELVPSSQQTSERRDLQKKLNSKEIYLGDTLDRVEYSKAFISQMENKIKELEASNRLLRLKVLSIPETSATSPMDNNSPKDTPAPQQQPYPSRHPVVPEWSQSSHGGSPS